MKKAKYVAIAAAVVLAAWAVAFLVDYSLVSDGRLPLFCVQGEDNRYRGAGYSYDIAQHPFEGVQQYCLYLLGNAVESTFTNEIAAGQEEFSS